MKLFKKRVFICTFTALASGLFGAYVGGQIKAIAHNHQCDVGTRQGLSIPGLNTLCKAWNTPFALWEGSTTGLWTGTILGAFIGGLATRQTSEETDADDDPSLSAQDREVLRRLLVLMVVKSAASGTEEFVSQTSAAEVEQLFLAELADKPKLTQPEVRQLLLAAGFSALDIESAWEELRASTKGDRTLNN